MILFFTVCASNFRESCAAACVVGGSGGCLGMSLLLFVLTGMSNDGDRCQALRTGKSFLWIINSNLSSSRLDSDRMSSRQTAK